LSHVTKRCIVKIINSWSSTSRCTNLLLWPVCFVRHVGVDRFRVDRECRHEENWLRLNERLVRSRVQVHVTVCGVKNCPTLLNCPRKLKKFLSSIFLNFLCQIQKKIALRAMILSFGHKRGRAVRGALKKSLSPICPRKNFVSKLAITFEFVHRLLEKQSLSHVAKRCKVKIINTWSSTSRCTNLLLWPVCFVRHVGVDRFRVDRECRHEENWLRLNERLVRSRVQVHVTVCGVKNCPTLLNCPRKLKKFLSSIFLNFLCQLQKKSRFAR
jgi:hypothetical protein